MEETVACWTIVKYVSFLNTSFRDVLCLTPGSFNSKNKSVVSQETNITDMIALTHECPGHYLITFILTHLCLRTISGVTVTCRTVWLFEALWHRR